MTRKLTFIALALAVSAFPNISMAREANVVHLQTLSEVSGIRIRQVRMLFAAARSSYAEYRYTFDRVERRFIDAVGEERYRQLQAGAPVTFDRMVDGRRVVTVVQLDPST